MRRNRSRARFVGPGELFVTRTPLHTVTVTLTSQTVPHPLSAARARARATLRVIIIEHIKLTELFQLHRNKGDVGKYEISPPPPRWNRTAQYKLWWPAVVTNLPAHTAKSFSSRSLSTPSSRAPRAFPVSNAVYHRLSSPLPPLFSMPCTR